MTKSRKQTIRRRNTGAAINAHRTKKPDNVSPIVVTDINPHWSVWVLTAEQAASRGWYWGPSIAIRLGYGQSIVGHWRQRFDHFPEPKCLINDGVNTNRLAYDIKELCEWIKTNRDLGHIQHPRKKNT
jgi:hypothetical protein